MPKRSNPFQDAVGYVVEQLAPTDAKVRHSVELEERDDAGTAREVDTLVEQDLGVATMRVAIEARDQKRRSDIQWIDELIGKYARLPIHKVIAVSGSGFSEGAKAKAAANSIEVVTPEEVRQRDWPSEFTKIGAATSKGQLRIVNVRFVTEPQVEGRVPKEARVGPSAVSIEERPTAQDLLQGLADAVIARAKRHVSENFLTLFKTLEDLRKLAIIELPVPVAGCVLTVGGTEYGLNEVVFTVHMEPEVTIGEAVHKALWRGKALISRAKFDDIEVMPNTV